MTGPPPSPAQQRLIDVGMAYWRRMVSEDAPLGVELLPEDDAVVVSHAVRGGGRIYVATDESVLFAGSAASPHESIEMFRSGRRTPPEQFRRRRPQPSRRLTSFTAPQPQRAEASLVAEEDVRIWGERATRHAAWARELLSRLAVQRGERFERADLRYAVTAGPEELAVVWPMGNAVVYVGHDGTVRYAEADRVRREDYDAFARGERTPIEWFGAPPADEGDLARSAVPALADGLAARAGLDVHPRQPGVLLAIGDMELEWIIAEEDGGLVAFRVERGSSRELVRTTDPAAAVRAIEASLGVSGTSIGR